MIGLTLRKQKSIEKEALKWNLEGRGIDQKKTGEEPCKGWVHIIIIIVAIKWRLWCNQ